ncbi:hypothetical protein [Pseudonocardia sp. T1-2H]|uniref:hypothetical protein n=1 Tax=Pseudonocardia sp. T1-2H TaxID=3128899 RepID=UPI00405426BD
MPSEDGTEIAAERAGALDIYGATEERWRDAREYGVTDIDGSAPDAWRRIVGVQDPGLRADNTGYR